MEAAKAASELLSMGLVELYYCQEPYGAMRLIPDAKAAELLGTSDVWRVPLPGGISVRFSATEEAAAIFFNKNWP